MMLKLYPLLSTRSKRAISRRFKRFGIPYNYIPRQSLIERLSIQTGIPEETIREELLRERLEILRESYGNDITLKDV